MDNYFKPHYMRWFYSPSTFWRNIKHTFRWLKWSWQRAFNGYAQCDVWETFMYLTIIIPLLIKGLKETRTGYPGNMTPEEWDDILGKIINGFTAADRIMEYDYKGNYNEQEAARQTDQVAFENGMKLLTKHWFNLWD